MWDAAVHLASGISIGGFAKFVKLVYDQFQLAAQVDKNCEQLLPALACLDKLLSGLEAQNVQTTSDLSGALELLKHDLERLKTVVDDIQHNKTRPKFVRKAEKLYKADEWAQQLKDCQQSMLRNTGHLTIALQKVGLTRQAEAIAIAKEMQDSLAQAHIRLSQQMREQHEELLDLLANMPAQMEAMLEARLGKPTDKDVKELEQLVQDLMKKKEVQAARVYKQMLQMAIHASKQCAAQPEMPSYFKCPITHEAMERPVLIAGSNQTCDKSSLERHLEVRKRLGLPPTCPVTGMALTEPVEYSELIAFRNAIQEWHEQQVRQTAQSSKVNGSDGDSDSVDARAHVQAHVANSQASHVQKTSGNLGLLDKPAASSSCSSQVAEPPSTSTQQVLVVDDDCKHVAHAVRLAPQDTRKCLWKHNSPNMFYVCLLPAWDVLFSPTKNYFRLVYDARGEWDLRSATQSTLEISIEVATEAMSFDDFHHMLTKNVFNNIGEATLVKRQFFINDTPLHSDQPCKGLAGRVSVKMVLYCCMPSAQWNICAQWGHYKGILEWSDMNFERLPCAMREIQCSGLSSVLKGTYSKGAKCIASLAVDFIYGCAPDHSLQDYQPVRLMECPLDSSNLNSKDLLLHCMMQETQMSSPNSAQGPSARRDELEQQLLATNPADELALWTACLPADFLTKRPKWYKESKPPVTTPAWAEVKTTGVVSGLLKATGRLLGKFAS